MTTTISDEINLVHFSGGSFLIPVIWKEGGAPLDLTTKTLQIYDVVPSALSSDMSITVTDAVAGKFSIIAPWSANWPTTLGPSVSFRVRITNSQALPPFKVYLK